MLERAKACLKAGAHQPLRCAQGATRSKRMLHSNFWQHGAGGLDLPPWAVGSMLNDPALKHDDRARVSGGEGKRRKRKPTAWWASPAESVFLDFLYPPQALAWAQKSAMQPLKAWERRNMRRLPEGFIHASRNYTSRSYSQAAEAGEEAEDEEVYSARQSQEHSAATATPEAMPESVSRSTGRQRRAHGGERKSHAEKDKADALMSGLNAREARDRSGGKDVGASAGMDQEEEGAGLEFANSPTDIVETGSDTLQQLRSLLTMSTSKLEAVSRVLRLYDELGTAHQDDLRLKLELLAWLSRQSSTEADVRSAELYRSIPVDQRTLQVYRAALSVFLRRGLHVQAVKLHKEALTNLPNGDQITKRFFAYAVREHRWQLAMNVEAQYRLVLGNEGARRNLFWLHVSETPRLIIEALALSRYLRVLENAKTINARVRYFCARFFAEALIQEFQTADHSKEEPTYESHGLPKQSVGVLFEAVGHLGLEAPPIYESLLMALLQQKHPNYRYTHLHRLVSYVYLALHKIEGYHISEGLLMTLLQRLTQHWSALRRQRELHHSLTVSTLTRDWQRYHGVISRDGVRHVLSWHASTGRVDRFETWMAYYKQHYPEYEDQKAALPSTIYVHARRADLAQAKRAFEDARQITKAYDEELPLTCWNILIHAQARSDHLEDALETLQMLVDKDIKPDEFSFHPVMEMLAKRGDVEGVQNLLGQYDSLADKKREAALYGSLLTAHINCDEIGEAEAVLKAAIAEVQSGNVRGSLTGCFNILLTAHALRRDVDSTMRTYRWMRAEGIRVDAETFAALIQALTAYRQTHSAYKILKKVMADHHIEPTAFHYALVMTGYIKQNLYDEALEVYERMQSKNIRPTFSTNVALLEAKALKEHREKRFSVTGKTQRQPLTETTRALRQMLSQSQGDDLATKQPQLGQHTAQGQSSSTAAYFSFLIFLHGKWKCFEAVQELYKEYKTSIKSQGEQDFQEPVQLLTALMFSYLRAGEYDEVERCWLLAKEQADAISRSVPVPQLSAAAEEDEPEMNIMELQPGNSNDAQEAGFHIGRPGSSADVGSQAASSPPPAKQTLITTGGQSSPSPKPSPGRNYILSRPIRLYLYALAAEGRLSDLLSTVAKLFGHGYTLDNHTWNTFIQLLCQASPQLVLLAFTLTERFLIPHFPGWAPVGRTYKPNPSARAEGLQYIRARYLRPGQLMPQYRTLVVLGAALLKLRRIEATGRRGMLGTSMKGMERYVGTARQVRQQAPKTLFAVQSMPAVDDALQNRLIRRR